MPMFSDAICKCALTRESRAQAAGVNRISAIGTIAALGAAAAVIFAPASGRAGVIPTIIGDGYAFTNFDPPLSGNEAGSNVNGISNTGQVVGTIVDATNASTFRNFIGTAASLSPLNTGFDQVAFGINSAGDVVGGNGTEAFYLPHGGSLQPLTTPAGAINAFGINDHGDIVGQYASNGQTPGFYLANGSNSSVSIDMPGPDAVNAQGINNNGLIVGFFVGSDGQAHGFTASTAAIVGDELNGTEIADPVIPPVPGELGATFVFSQILGVDDQGIAVGYYGDSTTSQHGFLYNTHTGAYTFVDDPAAAFHNGVEVTQITGISDSGEIAGFYTDANGLAHSFTASIVPEVSTWAMMMIGFVGVGSVAYSRSRKDRRAPTSFA